MFYLCVALLVIGTLALVLELIMPGYDGFIGGIIGVIALVASAVLAMVFVPGGWIFVGISVTVLVICAHFAYLYVRRQQMHGKILLSDTLAEDLPQLDYPSLVGKEGKTVTQLRPTGEIDINGTRVEATALGQIVERGVKVRIVEAKANKLIVSVVNGN